MRIDAGGGKFAFLIPRISRAYALGLGAARLDRAIAVRMTDAGNGWMHASGQQYLPDL
ncbi:MULTISPECIES: hypothetical protein [Ralstonia]|uniref:hypothetical protein n=1 Tax=Ralstonia TaxID=48736 RepID=UPI00164BF45E|nr:MULTISPECIES: hypothetical protein [unclassified Ralstonia]